MNREDTYPYNFAPFVPCCIQYNAGESYNLVLGERVLRRGDEGRRCSHITA